MYRAYLNSQEVDAIFAGNRQALAGIDILRKICNHPDLLERTKWEGSEEYGKPERSGKLTVLMKVRHRDNCLAGMCHSGMKLLFHEEACYIHVAGSGKRGASPCSGAICLMLKAC